MPRNKGNRVTYQARYEKGPVQVEGWEIIPGLFAARWVEDDGRFTLDHIPSGASCGREWRSRREVEAVAAALVVVVGAETLADAKAERLQADASWPEVRTMIQRATGEAGTAAAKVEGWPLRVPAARVDRG